MNEFDYNTAFSRNLGWLSPEEQDQLKKSTVAIAGLGGVGGLYCTTLARFGVGHFKIADFDSFEIHNFNRQHGSGMSTLGRKKFEVAKNQILDINPDAKVEIFSEGITEQNMGEFISGSDLYLDGLDLFALDIRQKVFAQLRVAQVPAVTVAPMGMGASMMVFTKDSMSFDDYFALHKAKNFTEKTLRFAVSVAPSSMHLKYMVYRAAVDIEQKKVPSTPAGVALCAGVAASTAIKILLNRGCVYKAPWSLHYDAYLNKYKKSWRPWGHKNPLLRIKIKLAAMLIQRKS
ncbi:MAG: ThiF family adenylyltransferase [Bdellovibrionales bacterium]